MPEKGFSPERRKFLEKLGKFVLGVAGVSALSKCESDNDDIAGALKEEHKHSKSLAGDYAENANRETGREKLRFSHTGVLKEEIEKNFEKMDDKERELLKSEWERISKTEEKKMYERRFKNSDSGVKKYFNDIIAKPMYRKAIGKIVRQYAEEFFAPEEIVLGMIGVESGGDNDAVSNSKPEARGILQLLPAAAREMGLRVDNEVDERKNIEKNIKAGIAYLAKMKERFGSWGLALIAFCEGPTKLSSQLRELQVPNEEKTIVHLYSKEFYRLGTTHPFQYPFYVNAMSKQMLEIMNEGRILPIEKKREKKDDDFEEEGKKNVVRVV